MGFTQNRKIVLQTHLETLIYSLPKAKKKKKKAPSMVRTQFSAIFKCYELLTCFQMKSWTDLLLTNILFFLFVYKTSFLLNKYN